MIYADSHTHSVFSFDGHQTVDELCRSAIEKGITKIALTDHLDCDGEFEGFYDHYDAEGAKKAVLEAREKYKGQILAYKTCKLTHIPYSAYVYIYGACYVGSASAFLFVG